MGGKQSGLLPWREMGCSEIRRSCGNGCYNSSEASVLGMRRKGGERRVSEIILRAAEKILTLMRGSKQKMEINLCGWHLIQD